MTCVVHTSKCIVSTLLVTVHIEVGWDVSRERCEKPTTVLLVGITYAVQCRNISDVPDAPMDQALLER